MPPAPPTFSMMTCWPRTSERRGGGKRAPGAGGGAENARQGVGGAAGRERHHHRDRSGRPVLGHGRLSGVNHGSEEHGGPHAETTPFGRRRPRRKRDRIAFVTGMLVNRHLFISSAGHHGCSMTAQPSRAQPSRAQP